MSSDGSDKSIRKILRIDAAKKKPRAPAVPARSLQAPPMVVVEDSIKEDWSCERCTLINSASSGKCDACGASRVSKASESRMQVDRNGLGHHRMPGSSSSAFSPDKTSPKSSPDKSRSPSRKRPGSPENMFEILAKRRRGGGSSQHSSQGSDQANVFDILQNRSQEVRADASPVRRVSPTSSPQPSPRSPRSPRSGPLPHVAECILWLMPEQTSKWYKQLKEMKYDTR